MSELVNTIRYPVPSGTVTDKSGDSDECTHIECKFAYELGGYSCAMGQYSRRGYYIYVRPVRAGKNYTSFTLFHGRKELLVECSRQSGKKEAEARAKFMERARALAQDLYPGCATEFDKAVFG